MSDGVKCPKCGGIQVSDQPITEVRKISRPYTAGCRGIYETLFYGLGIFIAEDLFLFLVVMPNIPGVENNEVLSAIFLATLFIPPIVFMAWNFIRLRAREKRGEKVLVSEKITTGHQFKCSTCGNSWTEMINILASDGSVLPEVIAQAESQPWDCSYCGASNMGTDQYCIGCTLPRSTK